MLCKCIAGGKWDLCAAFNEFAHSVEQFLKYLNLLKKVILVISIAPSHLEDELRNGHRVIFLLPNATLHQPVDQDVLEVLRYHHDLLRMLSEVIWKACTR